MTNYVVNWRGAGIIDKLDSEKELKAKIGKLQQLLFNPSLKNILSNWEVWGVKWNTSFLEIFFRNLRKLQIWKPDTCAKLISSKEM